MGRIDSYQDLIVWRRSMDLAQRVYEATRLFPREEMFGLTSQARRAAVSVPANIAEGHGRGTRMSYASFLRIARGSLKELETHMLLASRLEMIDTEIVNALLAETEEIGRMLHALIARLREPEHRS